MMNKHIKKSSCQFVATVLLLTLAAELILPATSYALTTGPSQPEMQSFEPVGTTDMVDMASGDFNYNIPLLDVEGYPVNIAYHSGVNMEQEASWVGLGWNINPGNVNHVVRGIPDDFNGDEIKKTVDIKEERACKFSMLTGAEFAGIDMGPVMGKASQNFSMGINYSNYNGLSAFFGSSQSLAVVGRWITAGANIGATVNTADGAEFDYSLDASTSIVRGAAFGASINGAISTKQGVEYTSFGASAAFPKGVSVHSSMTNIPIGLKNYVPVVTNASTMTGTSGQLKIGGEIYMIYPYWGGSFNGSNISFNSDGTKNAYGYFNLGNAGSEDIVDFTRDKDGRVHRKTKYLPMGNMTYDIYSISGQGTGGNFRGFRNDVGTVYDPLIKSDVNTNSSHLLELGFGNIFEIGFDIKHSFSNTKSGPWDANKKMFCNAKPNSLFEPYYLKQAGELTQQNEDLQKDILLKKPLTYTEANTLIKKEQTISEKRTPRANLAYFLNAEDASLKQVSTLPELLNYDFDGFKTAGSIPTPISRFSTDANAVRRKNQASEFNQILPDGRRYIYGLPVMNNYTKEYEFSCEPNPGNPATVQYSSIEPQAYDNTSTDATQRYKSYTVTPSYAHSYMLTSVLSSDYTDLTGNGISDDDLGNYTKFNYRKREDYNWRAPYKAKTANYNKGVKSNCNDDKAGFTLGSREQWLLHSIESRNNVAEFFTSKRSDARASDDGLFGGNRASSYKLDSIVLYNRKERFKNPLTAIPIKKVVFSYDYSLCQNIPNSDVNKGKLTLKAIYIKYGNSDIGYLSPYQFTYSASGGGVSQNPTYDLEAKDCWGNYKPANSNADNAKNLKLDMGNNEYPYVNQNDPDNDEYAKAWNLKEIKLPSGGSIKVQYESDDYGYVQDKHAMEMFKIEGVGPTSNFIANNSLYQDFNDPYLYLYFQRKQNKENGTTILKDYLDDQKIIQYNFEVNINPGSMVSCTNTPLTENIKGYAEVVEGGICDNANYGYIKIAPKTNNNFAGLDKITNGAQVNPISLATINFARYYNNKALNPEGELSNIGMAEVITKLISSFSSFKNFFENPIKSYLKKQLAKNFNINRSYIRLVSQGLKKKGGGHRVKKLEFFDTWEGSGTANYGSNYDYKMQDPETGKTISSGVASYEPVMGGDENPCRTLLNMDKSGNSSKFPPVDPIELLQEAPLGESLYPSPTVVYSKVTVSSIHKTEGESSQMIQEYEYYTAKDFPIRVDLNDLNPLEDRKPKIWDLYHTKDIYRVAQGYALYMNDMHGKAKKQSLWVDKSGTTVGGNRELVSYTKYEYFTNPDQTLNNNIPCLEFTTDGVAPKRVDKLLGEETDITLDSREKEDETYNITGSFNSNAFLAPPLSIYIPTGFPGFKKETNIFSSLVNTKVVQKYGVIKAVENYKKGALVRAENIAFDPKTGQALVTKINTEHNDNEYTIKYPAYWAYRCMGAAYENILYEEDASGAYIMGGKMYLKTNNLDKYNIGDEVLLDGTDFCSEQGSSNKPGKDTKYKLWVTAKEIPDGAPMENCASGCDVTDNSRLIYYVQEWTNSTAIPAIKCLTLQQVKQELADFTHNPVFNAINAPIEKIELVAGIPGQYANGMVSTLSCEDGRLGCTASAGQSVYVNYIKKIYTAKTHKNFNSSPRMFTSAKYHEVHYDIAYIRDMCSHDKNNYTNDLNQMLNEYKNGTRVCPWIDAVAGVKVTLKISADINSASILGNNWDKFYVPVVPSGNPPNNIKKVEVQRNLARGCGVDRQSYSMFGNISKATSTTVNRQKADKYLVLAPYKKQAVAINDQSYTWPTNDLINKGKIKVIRSGKRNQLQDNAQEISTVNNPIPGINSMLPTVYDGVISAKGRSYTDAAAIPENFDNTTTEVFNKFVVGQKGNYRVLSEYLPHAAREYYAGSIQSDEKKGLFNSLSMLWLFPGGPSNDEFYKHLKISGTSNRWQVASTVIAYSPWGADLEVEDAVKNRHSNIMGYSNRMLTATVNNCAYNNAISENFEDFAEVPKPNPATPGLPPYFFYQNDIRKTISGQIDANTLLGTGMSIIKTVAHTGTQALQIANAGTTFQIPVGGINAGALKTFYFRPGTKYIIDFWQKSEATAVTGLRLNVGNINCIPVAKTPSIDGWVLYEGEITIPASLQGQLLNLNCMTGGVVLDDFRILPVTANMKSYVYNAANRRLVAMLDENHMATLMEYSNEGKLVRVKKETEKGILTIKESRESLKNTYPTGGGVITPPDSPY